MFHICLFSTRLSHYYVECKESPAFAWMFYVTVIKSGALQGPSDLRGWYPCKASPPNRYFPASTTVPSPIAASTTSATTAANVVFRAASAFEQDRQTK